MRGYSRFKAQLNITSLILKKRSFPKHFRLYFLQRYLLPALFKGETEQLIKERQSALAQFRFQLNQHKCNAWITKLVQKAPTDFPERDGEPLRLVSTRIGNLFTYLPNRLRVSVWSWLYLHGQY